MGAMLTDLIKWFESIGDDPILARAQAAQLHRQIPLLYGLLLINSIAIAYTHWGKAPILLTLSVPLLLFGTTAARLVYWAKSKPPTAPEFVRKRLRTVVRLAGLFGFFYVVWSLSLAHYGGAFEQAHIALYISTTVIGCIFCLVHLPQAAVVVATCVIPAFMITYLDHQLGAFGPIALNVILVVVVLLRVLFHSFDSFRNECTARAELARLNAENERMARTDALTGLNNRRCFYDDLAMASAERENVGRMTVGLIDLDRFKCVNDTFGHHIGDKLLLEVATRLKSIAADARLYRLGGDEFAMIVYRGPSESRRLADRMCQAVAMPVRLADRQLAVGATIGLAPHAEFGLRSSELAERADYALYHAKRNHAGRAVLFSRELEREIRRDHAIQVELQSSNFEEELDVHVQPIVDACDARLVGGEILVRWNSGRLGPIDPERFIGVAERSTLIHRITANVASRALHVLTLIPDDLFLSVNISACDLNSPETVEAILRSIEKSGQDPSRLCVEVTETAVMRDMDAAIRALARFRSVGIKVALDDFGTGYSSLSNLHRLPLDKVKIDRSFAKDIDTGYSGSIANAVVGLCRTRGLTCIAEGVETWEQASALREMGCDLMQGYLFGRPLTPKSFASLAHGGQRVVDVSAAA
jgi:diguanylate cyclase (GGDEF)-like protein